MATLQYLVLQCHQVKVSLQGQREIYISPCHLMKVIFEIIRSLLATHYTTISHTQISPCLLLRLTLQTVRSHQVTCYNNISHTHISPCLLLRLTLRTVRSHQVTCYSNISHTQISPCLLLRLTLRTVRSLHATYNSHHFKHSHISMQCTEIDVSGVSMNTADRWT